MLNVTPMQYSRLSCIHPNRAHGGESIERQIADTLELLKNLGRASTDLGVSA
jgi:hypothetical protein